MRRRTRYSSQDLLPAPEHNTRQFIPLALAMILAVLLIPVGVQAAQTVSAFITDSGGVNQATVDVEGNLHVAAHDPARVEFHHTEPQLVESGHDRVTTTIDVPDGKRLVLTFVSGRAAVPTGQTLVDAHVSVGTEGNPTPAVHHLVPSLQGGTAAFDVFAFAQEMEIPADGTFQVVVERFPSAGVAQIDVAVSGYLIDCSVAACN
jgi:hypothetical protein